MIASRNNVGLGWIKNDLLAGVVVFLVAIPLCLGIALASGAPLFSGIISGIIGGIVVGLLSESAVSVSGPAAGMAAVVLAAIAELGGFNTFLLALVFAGILQIGLGSLRAGFLADYIPSNVIQGLLCAIGILIIIKQIPFILTYTSENKELMASFKSAAGNLSRAELAGIFAHINLGAITIGLLSLLLLMYFDKTQNVMTKRIPGSVIVVIVGTLANEVYANFFPTLMQNTSELVNIPVTESISAFVANLQTPSWSSWTNPNVYLYGFILAAVASLEALLNLEGIEKLDKVKRYCSRNRELVAQGIGNTLAGLMGGLPITSVIVRSSVNINSGATTKISTIFHGLLILLVVLVIPHWMNAIPLAALAAILINVGYKLTKPSIYIQMYQQGAARFIPFIVTIIAIIGTNLLTGVIIGLLTGFFFILRANSQIQLDIINEKYPSGDTKRLVLPQHMSFLRKASLVAELMTIPNNSRLVIDARYAKYIDKDIQEVLDVFQKDQAPQKRISLNMLGFKDRYEIHDHIEFLNVTNYRTQSSLKPDNILTILKEGNQRFIRDQPIHRYLLNDVKASSYTQHPLAIILGCIDSRVPVESIFDVGFGDVFVSRIAGNVMNEDILASVEFACHYAGAKLIVVLGHTYCGAIKAACDHTDGGQLKHLLDKIQPAIAAETETIENRTSTNIEFITNVTKLNIKNTVQHIHGKSNVLNRLINAGDVGLIGATYDIKTGMVEFHKDLAIKVSP
jgi:carbonic anhydrase